MCLMHKLLKINQQKHSIQCFFYLGLYYHLLPVIRELHSTYPISLLKMFLNTIQIEFYI